MTKKRGRPALHDETPLVIEGLSLEEALRKAMEAGPAPTEQAPVRETGRTSRDDRQSDPSAE